MRICVTGAGGYIGRGVVERLINAGNEVIAVGNKLSRVDSRAEKIEADIFTVDDPVFAFSNPDTLLHLAWKDGFRHQENTHLDNLSKHCAFLEAFAKNGECKICVMGSMHEIGYHEGAIVESTPCRPMSRYGIAKNALREFVQLIADENAVAYQWLRGYYIVDGNIDGESVFSKITKSDLMGEKVFPFTSGKNQYDFLDYHDFCDRLVAVVSQDDFNGVINICSGKPESLADRMERFMDENGLSISLGYGMYPDRAYDSPGIWGDSTIIDTIMSKYLG